MCLYKFVFPADGSRTGSGNLGLFWAIYRGEITSFITGKHTHLGGHEICCDRHFCWEEFLEKLKVSRFFLVFFFRIDCY